MAHPCREDEDEGTAHRVPLSSQAVENSARARAAHQSWASPAKPDAPRYVFPGVLDLASGR